MNQAPKQTNRLVVGVFQSNRDVHEALRALQMAGLPRDDAHVYRAGQGDRMLDAFPVPSQEEDKAEYVAHGEHQGVVGAHNRFIVREPIASRPPAPPTCDDGCRERTLLVISISDDTEFSALGAMLHDHGAIAVKDPAGHWRLSPYRANLKR